jgi:hypothetical protein
VWYWSAEGGGGIYSKPATGLGAAKLEFKPITPGVAASLIMPTSLSRDGKHLLYAASPGTARASLWVHSLIPEAVDTSDRRLIETNSQLVGGRFSPDGCWIAYSTPETERLEINVISFPNRENKVIISTAGGVQPRWRPDGKELFYIGLDRKMMSVALETSCNSLKLLGEPQALFQTRIVTTNTSDIHYDVTADGQRFLVNRLEPKPITLHINWASDLQK